MVTDHFTWNTPWELYFHILIFIPILQRLIFLGEPALKAIQIHGHHLRWLFERLKEIPKGYSIAAKFTVGLLVPATIALMRFIIFEPENGVVEVFGKSLTPPDWNDTPDWQLIAIVVFFVGHTYLDWRRVWDTRNLAIKIIKHIHAQDSKSIALNTETKILGRVQLIPIVADVAAEKKFDNEIDEL